MQGVASGMDLRNRKAAIVAAQESSEKAEGERAGGKERRRSRRLGCAMFAEAVVAHQGSLFRGEIRDISQNGCYIATNARLKLELLTNVDIRFMVNNCYYHASARVMNIRPGKGVGLEFYSVDAQAEERFQKLLQALSLAAPPVKA
jgi:hypothetical protein